MIFQYHIQYPYGPQCVISVQKNPRISFKKIPDIMDPLNTGNGILCCNIGYPFLLECFIPYLTSIGRGGGEIL